MIIVHLLTALKILYKSILVLILHAPLSTKILNFVLIISLIFFTVYIYIYVYFKYKLNISSYELYVNFI